MNDAVVPVDLPKVSVVIPCRNEKSFISKALDSILKNDYPKELMEVLIVDGMSDDGTLEVVEEYVRKYPYMIVLLNERRIVPTALNIGIRAARGSIIVRMDAHNTYAKDYISQCVKYMEEYRADNVGGVWVTLPGDNTYTARAIAMALASPFGVGNAYYRIGAQEPRFVDTVPFGCYKREVFSRIGLFDEDLVRNQDDEFNHRLLKSGGKILLAPGIISYYHARNSIPKLWRMFYQYGYFKPLVTMKVGGIFTVRQLVPPLFTLILMLSGILSMFSHWSRVTATLCFSSYLLASVGASLYLGIRRSPLLAVALPFIFGTIHFGYGVGYLKGVLDFVILKRHLRRKMTNLPLTR